MVPDAARAEPRLRAAAKRWLQLAWLVLVLSVTGLYALGLWTTLRTPVHLCDEFGPDCTEAAVVDTLASLGLTPGLAQGLNTALSGIGVPVGCLLCAGFIFWRRRDRPMTLAISALLALYGPLINTFFVDIGLARLGLTSLADLYRLAFYVLFYYVLLTFPDGRFVPRWSWLIFAVGLVGYVSLVLIPGAATEGAPPVFLLIPLLALGLQVYRYRRVSGPVERQQTKWALVGLAAFLLNFLIYIFWLEPLFSLGVAVLPYLLLFAVVNLVLVLSLPATLMIAALRYRLWDIDVIVRRTLVYAALTGLLALLYLGIVVITQNVLRVVTGADQSGLVTVVSTLAIAALFGPLRRRVQAAIDRRFYRRGYNAARIIAAFGQTLRDEVSLELVTTQLIDVVDDTLQPAQATLWLKPPNSAARRQG
jgi:hypothetical protein